MREDFYKKLLDETIEIYFLDFKNGKENNVYVLLHCPLDRLLKEAEEIKLEMRINNVIYEKWKISLSLKLNKFFC